VGCCERGDEPSGSGTKELASYCVYLGYHGYLSDHAVDVRHDYFAYLAWRRCLGYLG
jgi:hypothetical protein